MAFCENHSGTPSIITAYVIFRCEKSDHLNNGLKNETDFVKQEIAVEEQKRLLIKKSKKSSSILEN